MSKTPQELGRLKWGLGKMLCDVHANGGAPPVVLPFWHSGMEKVKRYGLWGFFPFNRVHVTVGEPVDPRTSPRAVRTMHERRAEGGALQRHDGARGGEDARDEGQERARTTRRRCVSARKNRRARGEPATLPDVESNQPRQSFVCLPRPLVSVPVSVSVTVHPREPPRRTVTVSTPP